MLGIVKLNKCGKNPANPIFVIRTAFAYLSRPPREKTWNYQENGGNPSNHQKVCVNCERDSRDREKKRISSNPSYYELSKLHCNGLKRKSTGRCSHTFNYGSVY